MSKRIAFFVYFVLFVLPVYAHVKCGVRIIRHERHVTTAVRKQVFLRNGVPWEKRAGYRVDHIVPLELGGRNSPENLQLQTVAEAHEKDLEENCLRRLVCAGKVALSDAQERMKKWKHGDCWCQSQKGAE